MKRTILVILAVAALKLLTSAGVDAHTRAASSSRDFVAQDKQTRAESQKQQRRVKGQTLTSDVLPPIRIRFDKAFKYVGSQSFILYNSARVEQYFFVAANRGRIKRMFMVQFEGYLPDNTHTYNYNLSNKVMLGGLDFMTDTSVGNVPAFRKQYPDSDAGRAATFLEGKGYQMEGEDIIYQRFVRLVDEARRNEMLIVYYESLSGTGFSAADLSEKGRAAGQRDNVFQEVMKRALKGFKVL